MLEAVHSTFPDAYSFIHASYSAPSSLYYGSDTISSEEGVQQGDLLEPLLFCLTIHPILSKCKAELRAGYLDDVTLGEELSMLANEVDLIKSRALKLGLELNEGKCELITVSPSQSLPQTFANFTSVSTQEAILLGSPLSFSPP